ncbi:uncharacterized protein F5891DRAFT_1054817 [Suillus fuscotomentosus]|uniref:U3 small nucleolar RNA-associated protein 10 n=1 Tax=Suillus fuscotomentosus TaxID=1912939 RepID=A0AAD4DZ51_9AGAM|nr:uncharacterized protein F5891DRAFT_1054817 [Suillus fuscotomentosus]KAG1896221.1 hypothetical protein F5891DRAFT_1054817 [Suillus fuscotomentosus]
MPSALASQLAASASLNASLLDAHTNKRRRTESYLFTGRDADVHDLDSIHALASNAFAQLSSLSPAFTARTAKLPSDGSSLSVDFDQTLFSEAARNVDRTMQSREVNANLDRTLNAFLSLLGPWLMEAPTSKVLEWLVRRFRINEFNVDAVLSLFFPYHESPHFVKMLSILHISSSSIFSFLLPFKSTATPLARSSIVKAMAANQAVARFIASLLPTAIRGSSSHHTLVAFNAATMHDYIASSPALDEGILAFLLSALLAPFQTSHSDANATLGSYVLLSTLSHKVSLSSAAVVAIIGAMATSAAPKGKRNTKDDRCSEQFVKVAIAVCSPQEELETFHANTGNLCLKIPTFTEELRSAVQFVGAEKFILPILECLKPRLEEPVVSSLYAAILSATGTPLRLLERLVSSLIRLILTSSDEESVATSTTNAARALLSLVHQRHVDILRDAVGKIIEVKESEHEGDDQRLKKKERKTKADELMISFSVSHPWAQSTDVNEIVVASTSTAKEARVGAVERLYKILQGGLTLEASDKASIQSALLARVYDTHAGVLHVLYSSPEVFLSTVTSSITPQKLLDAIVSQIGPDPPARAVLIAHVAFLAGHFSKTYPDLSQAVQESVLFPYLLASKSKFRTARGVWKALKEAGGTATGWLRGCVDIWEKADLLRRKNDEENDEADVDMEKICQANLDVAAKIAENILASNDSSSDISLILLKLHDPLPHGRALAYLVVRVLLLSTSCGQQVDIALQVLAAMKLHSVDGFGDLADSSANLQEVLNDATLGMKVTTKPGGRITVMFLQASILALIPAIRLADARTPTWITTSSLSDLLSEKKSVKDRYVALMQNLYAVAVASGSITPSQLSTHLIQALFLNLRDTSLMFLLGVLLAQSPTLERVRTRALLHALAFLRGHNSDNAVDFQTVLPSFIAVLMDARTDKQGRALIFECISVLASTSERKHVYGLDTIYGAESTHLQYLDAKDLEGYLKALLECHTLLAQDGNYIKVFHQQHFAAASAKYRRRVICYLLSHAVTHPVPEARISIMSSVEDVSDTARSHMVLSAMETLAKDPAPISKLFGVNFHRYTALVASTFLSVPVGDLNTGTENSVWLIFSLALQAYFKPNAIATVRKLFSDALEERLFAHLDTTRQAQICDILLSAGSLGNEVYVCAKELLSNLLQDVHLINHLLVVYQPAGAQPDTPASKRAKLDNPSHGDVEEKMSIFTFLAEVLGTKELPGSLDLLTQLLDTLGKIIHNDSPIPSDTSYPCQMLMAAVEQAASKITEPPARPIRLDILVEIIRVSENPQTFHQALLLMASLARLTPDSVLHNIMPIFTFMGTNVFHRDDSYSFKVVQNTIENIVPVMVSSLKSRHPPGLELYIGAREFLRIFTDASNHIPRHRRQNFFIHLADVLGPQEFLAPVCMSLVDRVANRVSRQHEDEASTSLGLPISLLRHFPRELHLHVLKEVLREAQRLIRNIACSDEAGATFLDYVHDDEHSARSSSIIIKRRAQALIMFVGHAIIPTSSADISKGDNATTELVSLLVDLATIEGDSNISDILSVTQQTTSKVMNAIGAADFLNGALVMLQSDETRIKAGALEILAERIPRVTDAVRREQQKTVISIIDFIRDVVSRQSAGALVNSALDALKAIGSSICPGEETALVSTVPSVIKIIKARASLQSAIAVLPCYVSSLGPRLIPHFREIAQQCTSVLQEGLSGKTAQTPVDGAIATLQGLVSTLPAFCGAAELRDIVKLHLEYSVTLSGLMTGLMKAIAKKIPSNMLLPVLCDLWPNLEKSQKKEHVDGLIAFFVFFKRSLRVARRPDIQEHIRSIFSVFLDGFGVNMQSTTDGEPHIISAFLELVVKLNETAFRPLFRRLYDWAFAADDRRTANIERKITFCHMYSALLDYFKGLMNPYMSMLLQALCDILESLAAGSIQNPSLWLSTVETLTKSFENDDGVFWRDDKLASVAKPIIAQVSSCIRLNIGKQALTNCLIAMTSVAVDDSLLKSINIDLLMHTRAEDARERIFALSCSEALWREHGGKLIGFVAETTTFISECAEDENDSVVRETHKLKNAVEGVAGSISGL